MRNIPKALLYVAAVLAAVLVLFLVKFAFAIFLLDNIRPAKPEVTHGEFPFTLEYELQGETVTVSDVAVCDFSGFRKNGEIGYDRNWRVSLMSNSSVSPFEDTLMITLLDLHDSDAYDQFGNKILSLLFYGGNGYHFMGDSDGLRARDAQDFSYVEYRYQKADGQIMYSSLSPEEAFEQFGIRLLDWSIVPAIENTFHESWFHALLAVR